MKPPDELDLELCRHVERDAARTSERKPEAPRQREGSRGRRLLAAAAGRSGRRDVSQRIEEILRDEIP